MQEEDVKDEGEGEDAHAVGARSTADEDSVFMQSYIPRTLNEVFDPERDVGVLSAGGGEKLIYKDTIGIVVSKEMDQPAEKRTLKFADEQDDEDGSEGEESEDEGDDGDEEGDGEFKERMPRGHRHEDKEAKKVRRFPRDIPNVSH